MISRSGKIGGQKDRQTIQKNTIFVFLNITRKSVIFFKLIYGNLQKVTETWLINGFKIQVENCLQMQTYDNKGHCTVLRLKNFNGDYLIIRYTIFNKRIVWVNDRFRKLNINFEEKKTASKHWETRRIMHTKRKFINEKIVENSINIHYLYARKIKSHVQTI